MKTQRRVFRSITNAVEDGTKTLRRILEFARRDTANEFGPVEWGYLLTSSVDIARPKWQSKSRKGKVEAIDSSNARRQRKKS